MYQNITNQLNLGTITSKQTIQTLWSGYGELVRLNFKDRSVIIKHIKLPEISQHPYGWNSDLSHKRKLHSYEVEVNWYQNFSSSFDERCPIPQALKCFQSKDEWLIVMQDLASIGFTHITKEANINHIKASLKWLANFHAKYMNVKTPLIWESGTYWHLQTRPDELKALKDIQLKNHAIKIDDKLNSVKYKTIIHGDAKLANFCFDAQEGKAAAVDFQYVGHGCGMKDVILFMSSSVKPEDCESMERLVLDIYFSELTKALKHYQPDIKADEVQKEWRALFGIAWADFQRFIKGWKSDHFKINRYTESLTQKALKSL
jgi:hypothetical protein